MKVGGRAATNVPKTRSLASNPRKNLTFIDHQQNEKRNPTVPNFADTTPAVALTSVLLSQGGGGGETYLKE